MRRDDQDLLRGEQLPGETRRESYQISKKEQYETREALNQEFTRMDTNETKSRCSGGL